jgi:hypothetical protein
MNILLAVKGHLDNNKYYFLDISLKIQRGVYYFRKAQGGRKCFSAVAPLQGTKDMREATRW